MFAFICCAVEYIQASIQINTSMTELPLWPFCTVWFLGQWVISKSLSSCAIFVHHYTEMPPIALCPLIPNCVDRGEAAGAAGVGRRVCCRCECTCVNKHLLCMQIEQQSNHSRLCWHHSPTIWSSNIKDYKSRNIHKVFLQGQQCDWWEAPETRRSQYQIIDKFPRLMWTQTAVNR